MPILEDSIEIKATPEKVYDFFLHMEENYKPWHPDNHLDFRLIKGRALEEGAVAYFEEHLHGKQHKIKVRYTKILSNRAIEFRVTNPIWRIFYPKSRMTIEPKEDGCIFTATNHFRLGPISSRLKHVKMRLDTVRKHMKEEGENLKKLLEAG